MRYTSFSNDEFEELWPPEILTMLDPPSTRLDDAVAMLFQYQKIAPSWINEKRDSLTKEIREHLLKFGGKSREKTYDDISPLIEQVCKAAIPLIKNHPPYTLSSPISHLQFQDIWLTNTCRLLPETEAVMQVLPYLLSCYIISISGNRFDPFDKPNIKNYIGWLLIFQDQTTNQLQKELQNYGGGNRSKTISSVCQHFVLPPNYMCNAFLYGIGNTKKLLVCNSRHDRQKKKQGKRPLGPTESRKNRFVCWEYYRQFACFCKACENIENVNITLSLALFSSLWDMSSICRVDCENPVCDEESTRCSDPKRLMIFSDCQCSISDLEKDRHRKKILKALSFEEDDSTIQSYVLELWYKTAWKPLSDDKLKEFEKDSRKTLLSQNDG